MHVFLLHFDLFKGNAYNLLYINICFISRLFTIMYVTASPILLESDLTYFPSGSKSLFRILPPFKATSGSKLTIALGVYFKRRFLDGSIDMLIVLKILEELK